MTAPHQPLPATVEQLLGFGAFEIGSAAFSFGQNVTHDIATALIRGPGAALAAAGTDIVAFLSALGSYLATLPLEALQWVQQYIPGTVLAEFATVESAVAAIMNNLKVNILLGAQEFEQWLTTIFNVLVAALNAAWHLAGVDLPAQFVGLLKGLIPAATPQFNGTALATGVTGFVDNLNGTISYTVGEAENEVAHLIQQADGTVVTAAHVAQQIVAAAQSAEVTVGQAVATGQQMADHGIAAIEGTAVQAGQTAQQYASSLSNAFTGWVNSWMGTNVSGAAAPQVSLAASQAAAQSATQAAQTAAINAQLPHFYGGSGTSGLSTSVNFTGLTSLPAGWSSVSTSFAGSTAKYNTPAQTDSQTVSGVWSTSDAYPKYLILRASADFTTCTYAKIQSNDPISGAGKCKIAAVVAGVETVLSTFTLPGGALQANQAYTFEATDYTYQLIGPSALNVSVTDSSHVSQKGPLYVYGGFGTGGWNRGTTLVTTTSSYPVPGWAVQGTKFDVMALGAGNGYLGHGYAGQFSGATLGYGTGLDIPLTTTSFSVVPGVGGNVGSTDTTVTITGYGTITGPSGVTNTTGPNPVPTVLDNYAYDGAGYGQGRTGSGQSGIQGAAWITPIDMSLPGSMYSWAFYDSGPGAGPAVSKVTTGETTSSGTYVDLTTTTDQVTVNVGPSGLALVLLYWNDNGTNINGAVLPLMSFAMSGANTAAASDLYAIGAGATAQLHFYSGGMFLVPSLNPGATTFKAKYRSLVSNSATFYNRQIAVIPL